MPRRNPNSLVTSGMRPNSGAVPVQSPALAGAVVVFNLFMLATLYQGQPILYGV